jgi:hypothetical protein
MTSATSTGGAVGVSDTPTVLRINERERPRQIMPISVVLRDAFNLLLLESVELRGADLYARFRVKPDELVVLWLIGGGGGGGTRCDLCFQNDVGVVQSRVIVDYSDNDNAAQPPQLRSQDVQPEFSALDPSYRRYIVSHARSITDQLLDHIETCVSYHLLFEQERRKHLLDATTTEALAAAAIVSFNISACEKIIGMLAKLSIKVYDPFDECEAETASVPAALFGERPQKKRK